MNELAAVADRLRLGIEAAQTGQNRAAIRSLTAVLRQEPENITALLWLAFVLPTPQDSLRVLQRVLVLEPDNPRAKAGLRWAIRREGLTADESDLGRREVRSRPSLTASIASDRSLTTPQPLDTTQKKTRGLFPSHFYQPVKALLIVILVAILGIFLGSGLSFVVPPETMAAWLPSVPTNLSELDVFGEAPAPQPNRPDGQPSIPELRLFTSASDSISPAAFQSVESKMVELSLPQPEVSPPDSPVLAGSMSNSMPEAINPGSLPEPSVLIGPAVPVDPTPVDPALLAHQPAYPGEKWIEVNVTTQEVTAWEGNVPVLSFISSTGLPNTPTVLGEYNIYWKLRKTLMTGPGYYLPDVPYTMYFYQGYALHGTYWHKNFGQPMSRGCVNLSTDNAQKLFEWADPVIPPGQTDVWADADNPGTLVVVHR